MNHAPKTIALTKGFDTTVCAHDFGWLSVYKWHAMINSSNGKPYAYRTINTGSRTDGTRKVESIGMHRSVNKTPKGVDTDHIDRDPLNNLCTNLRSVTRSQNRLNMDPQKNNKSGYNGVTQYRKKWRARVSQVYLGDYRTPEEAAKVLEEFRHSA